MNDINKVLCAMPCNDRAIFLEDDGFIHERIGIVWEADEDDAENDSQYFVDKDGFIYKPMPVSDGENTLLIANIGETIRPEALASLPVQMYYPGTVFSKVEEFGVKIDRTHLSKTLKVFFENILRGICSVTIETTEGVRVMDGGYGDIFDLNNEDNNYRDRDNNGTLGTDPIYLLTSYLTAYSKLLGMRVNVEIYFRKFTPDIRNYEKNNHVVCEYEKKCLGKIRKTVNEKLNAAWEQVLDEVGGNQPRNDPEQQFMSKYDKDPNLME